MVDSRQKGATAESAVKKVLVQMTGLQWERVPGSGALDPKHKLKGDLYVVDAANLYCVEVKHYKDSQLDHTVLTGKNPQLLEWWEQAVRQGIQVGRKPLLIFKHDRSKMFVAFVEKPTGNYKYFYINANQHQFYVALLEEWINNELPEFVA